jgi:hypothetical protein
VSFAGAHTSLALDASLNRTGVAVDSGQNVFLTNTDNQVVELPKTATGYGPRITLPFSGLTYPYGIAVDTAGNVFVVSGKSVFELPRTETGYGAQITLPFSGLSYPFFVAVDSTDNVFVTDYTGDCVVELPWTGTGYGQQITLPFTGLRLPAGVAVDNTGDVFVADVVHFRVVELRRTSTGFLPQITLIKNTNQPFGVAVDNASNVFVTYFSSVVELPRTETGYGPPITIEENINIPDGVAVDQAGNVFTTNPANVAGFPTDVVEFQTHFVNFWGANVCAPGATIPAPCSQTLTLNFNVNADVTLGTPTVLTGGMTNLDFTLASGTTCTGAVAAGSTCTANVTFAPLAAGFRKGTVEIRDDSGNVITKTSLSGFGVVETTGPPVAQVSTPRLAFNTIDFGLSETLPLIVANIGGGKLTVVPSISNYSGNPIASYTMAGSTCDGGITPGNTCILEVEYSPKSIATHYGLLTLQTNGEPNPVVKLHGVATGLSVLGGISGASLQFGSVSSGSTEVLPLIVTNVGLPGTVNVGTAITVRATTRPTTTYRVLTTAQNTCLAGIAAGQSCTLPVELVPTSSGTHDDLLTLTPSPGGGSTNLWLIGSTP